MSEERSVTSEVEVGVDPGTAFTVFTEEIDLWWQRGPINFYDSARAVGMRCEPGVGGRLLEVYDDTTGDALELGRIVAWEPGRRLAWRSSVDDVEVEVVFEARRAGTTVVRVSARIPPAGEDRGGTAWVRVTPPWFGAWCARRDTEPHAVRDLGRLGLAVHYADPVKAAAWLHDVFGFGPPPPTGPGWIEFHVGGCSVMLFPGEGVPAAAPTHVPWVFVDDLDAHLDHAVARGATIAEPIRQHGYRAYVAEDLEGNRWTFAQARPTQPG